MTPTDVAPSTEDRLARLRPAFRAEGTVTAGNSCGINDGAAAVAVVDAATWATLGVPGLEVLAVETTAGDPRRPGIALVPLPRGTCEPLAVRPRAKSAKPGR